MKRDLPPLNSLRAFEAAARHLSFTHAAAELQVTQAAVSHQVKSLEAQLGVRLFQRLTRGLRLTYEGQLLLPELRDMFDQLALVTRRVSRKKPHGKLMVSAPATFGISWLVPRLARFNAQFPDIEVSLGTTPSLVDFARENVDVAVRLGRGPWPGLRADKLFDEELTILCGPGWAKKLMQVEDVGRAPLLFLNNDHNVWPLWLKATGAAECRTMRRQEFDSSRMTIEAAMAGAGLALGNPHLHADLIAAGKLCQPFRRVVSDGRSYWLVYPEAMCERPMIAAFRSWLLSEAALSRHSAPVVQAVEPAGDLISN